MDKIGENMYNTIIIGAGPAGITAGIYLKRANVEPLILYKDTSTSLEKAGKIENYYGFENPIEGKELYKKGIQQAENIGIDIRQEEVVNIEMISKNTYKVVTNIEEYICKSIIIATGNKRNKPKIENIKKYEGKGVSYCAVCDGFFYKNKNVAVLGNSNFAISEINNLINITNKIILLTNGQVAPKLRDSNIAINNKEIETIEGNSKLEQVNFTDGTNIKIDGLFIAQGVAGSVEFAKRLGLIAKDEKIVVDENMQTNIKGIFACGDCTKGVMQISKAVYEGTVAGLESAKYINSIKD